MGEILHAALNAMALFCGTAHSPCDDFIHRNMMLLSVGMLLLCLGVAGVYAQYNMKSMRNTLSLIAPQNQSQQASTVFEYMQEAIRSSQETEALLLAQTEGQRFLPRKIFLRRLLRGVLPLASDILREQSQVGLNLEGTYWTVASSISRKTMRTRPWPLAAWRPHSI